jgi:alpha-1,2-mannosyltransferase
MHRTAAGNKPVDCRIPEGGGVPNDSGGADLSFQDGPTVRIAWIGWAILAAATAVIIASGSGRTVVPAYREGAVYWMAGKTIFAHPGVGGFVYLPQAAVLFIPFSLLPVVVGEVVWRFVNIGVFALGIFQFARLVRSWSGKELFPLMTLVSLPLAWDCARNGQATLIMTGLMLLAVADIARSRWWRAVLWLSLGVAIKPLVIVLALLVMAIDRPLSWRVPVGMLVTALVPFVTQHPAYVLDQYAAFWSSLTKAVHVGAVDKGWTTPFNALQLLGIMVPEKVQTLLRIAAAFGTLALCYLSRRRHDAVRSAAFVFSLAVVYLMLFSPRTENNTYAMLGPAIAMFLAGAFLVEQRFREGLLLSCIALAIMGGRMIERMLTPHAGTSWLSPLMAVCFALYLLVTFFADRQEQAGEDRPAAA